jgi:ribulose 1,5-bisphosphate synthetase/thiazole synthase
VSVSQERTISLWMSTEVAPEARPLCENAPADTVIIGSGIAGLSTAYELALRGHQEGTAQHPSPKPEHERA